MPEKFKIMALTDLMSRGWGLFRGSQTMASPVSLHGRRKWPQFIDTDSISSDCRAPSFHAPSPSLCYCVLDFNPGIRGRPKCSDHSSYSKEQTPTHDFLNSSLKMGEIGKEKQGMLFKKLLMLCFVFRNKSEIAITWHLESSQI